MTARASRLAPFLALAALACGSPGASTSTGADTASQEARPAALPDHGGGPGFRGPPGWSMAGGNKLLPVSTRNLYLGADLAPVIAATGPEAFVAATTAVWDMVNVNSFALRAEGVADELASERPALVGLQEAYTWLVQDPLPAGGLSAPRVAYDDVPLLVDALAARGLAYRPVASITLFQFSAPIATGQVITLVDHGVILAREDVHASHPVARVYDTLLQLPVLDQVATVKRGWVSVQVKYRGEHFRFVSTHLEAFAAPIRSLQAQELAAALADEPLPIVLVGDLNAEVGDVVTLPPGSPVATLPGARDILGAAGFRDAWAILHPSDPGFTCCFPEDLRLPGALDQRIDYVLFRGPWRPVEAELHGASAADRVSGLWPSDHAGLSATLRILDPRFHR